jgi:hypothetical protein
MVRGYWIAWLPGASDAGPPRQVRSKPCLSRDFVNESYALGPN